MFCRDILHNRGAGMFLLCNKENMPAPFFNRFFSTMKAKYLLYAQACAMCRDYRHLQGRAFDDAHRIDAILMAPYSRLLQWQFLQQMSASSLHQAPPVANNPSGRYDVLLLAYTGGQPGYLKDDLRSYLSRTGLPFDPSRYDCLRHTHIPFHTLQQILE